MTIRKSSFRYSFYIMLFLMMLIQTGIKAQNNIEFDELNFPERKGGVKDAIKNMEKGDAALTKGLGRNLEALKYYLKAQDFNPNNALLNYKIGFNYLKTAEKYKALPYLEKSFKLNKAVKNDIAFLLGQAYHFNNEFDKAIIKFTEYQKSLSAFDKDAYGPKVDKKIQECKNGKELIRNPVNVKITNLGGVVNCEYRDYSPIVNGDQSIMFFTSRRTNTTGGGIAEYDGRYYEDIYITYFKDNQWTAPKNPGKPLNSSSHDAIGGVSLDGKTLLVYKETSEDNGDIYISKLNLDKYSKPKRLNKNINTTFHESSGSLSPDGNTLYFISDREGGRGGRDVYMSNKDANGEWGKAINLGPIINTSYNEEGVFMQADGKTLYFSSQGHNSMGGYDIFRTVFENGKWSAPKNIGYPINTADDDVFFSITQDGWHGYYASGQKGGYGELDIYQIEFFPSKTQPIIVKGKVLDAETKQPVCSDVKITDIASGQVVDTLKTDCPSGVYCSKVPVGKAYRIDVTAPEYIPYNELISKERNVNKIIYIRKPKVAAPEPALTIGNVFDADTKLPVCNADVKIYDLSTNKLLDSTKSKCPNGEYHSDLPKCKLYMIRVNATEYVPYKETIPECNDVNKIIYIEKVKLVGPVGNVYDEDTKEPVCDANIDIKSFQTKVSMDKLKSKCPDGMYQSELPMGKKYEINVTAPEYIPYVETIDPDKNVNKKIYIKKLKTAIAQGKLFDVTSAKSFVLPDILYDLDKFFLKPQYQDSLNGLIATMNAFPNIVIELGSHTDTRASDQYNERLSFNRAKAVVDYLITKGIAAERMVAKGYGEKVPRVLDKTRYVTRCDKVYTFIKGTVMTDEYINSLQDVKCEREAAHQLNRRTEFKVLREDYVPGDKRNKAVKIDVIKK